MTKEKNAARKVVIGNRTYFSRKMGINSVIINPVIRTRIKNLVPRLTLLMREFSLLVYYSTYKKLYKDDAFKISPRSFGLGIDFSEYFHQLQGPKGQHMSSRLKYPMDSDYSAIREFYGLNFKYCCFKLSAVLQDLAEEYSKLFNTNLKTHGWVRVWQYLKNLNQKHPEETTKSFNARVTAHCKLLFNSNSDFEKESDFVLPPNWTKGKFTELKTNPASFLEDFFQIQIFNETHYLPNFNLVPIYSPHLKHIPFDKYSFSALLASGDDKDWTSHIRSDQRYELCKISTDGTAISLIYHLSKTARKPNNQDLLLGNCDLEVGCDPGAKLNIASTFTWLKPPTGMLINRKNVTWKRKFYDGSFMISSARYQNESGNFPRRHKVLNLLKNRLEKIEKNRKIFPIFGTDDYMNRLKLDRQNFPALTVQSEEVLMEKIRDGLQQSRKKGRRGKRENYAERKRKRREKRKAGGSKENKLEIQRKKELVKKDTAEFEEKESTGVSSKWPSRYMDFVKFSLKWLIEICTIHSKPKFNRIRFDKYIRTGKTLDCYINRYFLQGQAGINSMVHFGHARFSPRGYLRFPFKLFLDKMGRRKNIHLHKTNEFRTTMTCSRCHQKMFVSGNGHRFCYCGSCKATNHRDLNGAANIQFLGNLDVQKLGRPEEFVYRKPANNGGQQNAIQTSASSAQVDNEKSLNLK
jgi:hypothetical protein